MGELAHWTLERVTRDEKTARKLLPLYASELKRVLSKRGMKHFEALPMPRGFDGVVKFYGPFRALTSWIPDWSPTQNAGKFVARIDVLAK